MLTHCSMWYLLGFFLWYLIACMQRVDIYHWEHRGAKVKCDHRYFRKHDILGKPLNPRLAVGKNDVIALDAWWGHDIETLSALLAQWLVDSPHKGLVMLNFDTFFVVILNALLSKAFDCQCFEMAQSKCDITVYAISGCSGAGDDHGPSLWWCMLRRHRYRPRTQVPKRRWPCGLLKPAELHRGHQCTFRTAPARRYWQKGR